MFLKTIMHLRVYICSDVRKVGHLGKRDFDINFLELLLIMNMRPHSNFEAN